MPVTSTNCVYDSDNATAGCEKLNNGDAVIVYMNVLFVMLKNSWGKYALITCETIMYVFKHVMQTMKPIQAILVHKCQLGTKYK